MDEAIPLATELYAAVPPPDLVDAHLRRYASYHARRGVRVEVVRPPTYFPPRTVRTTRTEGWWRATVELVGAFGPDRDTSRYVPSRVTRRLVYWRRRVHPDSGRDPFDRLSTGWWQSDGSQTGPSTPIPILACFHFTRPLPNYPSHVDRVYAFSHSRPDEAVLAVDYHRRALASYDGHRVVHLPLRSRPSHPSAEPATSLLDAARVAYRWYLASLRTTGKESGS